MCRRTTAAAGPPRSSDSSGLRLPQNPARMKPQRTLHRLLPVSTLLPTMRACPATAAPRCPATQHEGGLRLHHLPPALTRSRHPRRQPGFRVQRCRYPRARSAPIRPPCSRNQIPAPGRPSPSIHRCTCSVRRRSPSSRLRKHSGERAAHGAATLLNLPGPVPMLLRHPDQTPSADRTSSPPPHLLLQASRSSHPRRCLRATPLTSSDLALGCPSRPLPSRPMPSRRLRRIRGRRDEPATPLCHCWRERRRCCQATASCTPRTPPRSVLPPPGQLRRRRPRLQP